MRSKIAKLIVTDPAPNSLTTATVDITYRGKILQSFKGKRQEVGTMLHTANKWAVSHGFDNTKAEYH